MGARSRAIDAVLPELDRAIVGRRDELVGLVSELVKQPSQLGQEAAAQAYVAEQLRVSGMETDVWELDDEILAHPEAGRSGVPFTGRPNVAGSRAGASGGRSLILNGHIDVVSPEPVDQWTYDPWGATIVGDRMYGRGAYDMKCGVGLNIFIPRVIRDLGLDLAGDLIVHSVIEEECTGNGSLAASLRQRADAAIVTEPEGGRFTHAHVGVLWFKITVAGKSWHAMAAHRGVNAIVKMVQVIQALHGLEEELNRDIHPVWAGIEHPINLNIGVIHGGDWPSTVPGSCELHCRVSFFPGQSALDMRERIEETVRQAAAADAWLREHPPVVTYDGFSSSGSIVSLNEPSVELLGRHHWRVTGQDMAPDIGTAINDMRYYNFVGVPAGCYGATGGNGHAVDEWLDLNSLVPAAQVLAGFVVEWCGLAG